MALRVRRLGKDDVAGLRTKVRGEAIDASHPHYEDAYRDNYERLAKIKAKYHPGNLFRVNQNFYPAN